MSWAFDDQGENNTFVRQQRDWEVYLFLVRWCSVIVKWW